MSIKYILYDWFGVNGWLFQFINSFHTPAYDNFLLIAMQLGEHEHFKYYVLLTAIVLALRHLSRGIRRPWPVIKEEARPSAALLITMVMGFTFMAALVSLLKHTLKMPRPFEIYRNTTVPVHFRGPYPEVADYYASLPSGHATTITFLVAVLWPHLPLWGKRLGIAAIVVVCWARVAIGMHFPVDIVAGILIGLTAALLTRRYVYRMMRLRA